MGSLILAHPHWDALTPATRQAFQQAAGLQIIDRYYLAGGTGLALHLGHRFSVVFQLRNCRSRNHGSNDKKG